MSDSDSDDCFGNFAQKLEAMKNDYPEDNIKSPILLDDSAELECRTVPLNKKKNKSPVKKLNESVGSVSSGSIDIEEFNRDFPSKHLPKRTTRSSTRKRNSKDVVDITELALPTIRRKRKDTSFEQGSSSNEAVSSQNKSRGRGRGRGRGRQKKTTNKRSSAPTGNIMEVLQALVPTYSVGNTDEYPDECDSQELFGKSKKSNDVAEEDELNDTLEDNEELSVKVCWQSTDIFKFMVRKHQKFTQMFDFFSEKDNVTTDKLLFTYNDKIVKPNDTPNSIDYKIFKFIDGGVVNKSIDHNSGDNKEENKEEKEEKKGVKLKFQCQNVKQPFEISIKGDDKLSMAMVLCAEHFEYPLQKLRFEFDGDIISGKSSPNDLELEGGECIDVKLIS